MSSTGIKSDNYDNLEADIIDVNDSLFIKKINILDFINDLSENLVDLSENLVDLSENLVDLSENLVDLSENVYDISGNLSDLNNTVIDLSANVADIKISNNGQDVKLLGHSLQIQANSNAIAATDTLLGTTVATTGANTAAIATIVATIGIPSVLGITPSTGLYAGIDSKTSRSLFGSGNVAIYGAGALEYINLVYNNNHFEDIKLISNHELNLKEPYKSLPTSLNNLSNVVDTKQNIFTCISPLIKNDVSNNITIDLSAYVLKTNFDSSLNNIISTKQNIFTCISPLIKNDVSNNISIDLSGYAIGNIKGTKVTLNEGYQDSTGNSLIFYHNNAGTYFTDNSFNSFFNISSATATATGLAVVPFITNYNRMFKNGINNAIKIASTGVSNSNVNSSTYILLDSGGDPTPGANTGTIKFNITTQSQGALDRFIITPNNSIFYNNVGIGKTPSYNLDVSGNMNSTVIYENNTLLTNKYARIFDVVSPLIRDVSNNITIDLSAYPLKLNVDASLNNLQNKKQDIINVASPLIKDISNNISIDLSAYALKNALNASNVTSGTLPVSFGGTGSTTLNNNQILIGNGTNALLQTPNLLFDTSNNRLGICQSQPNYTLDVSGNINANNINLQNLSNPNNTTISINSETNSYNSKLILGSGYIGSNPANSFSDVSTCQIITKRYNLYIDAAVGKSININSEANGNVNSYGTWSHYGNLSTNDVSLNTLYVNTSIVSTNSFSSNATSKSLIKFQTKLGQNGLYYYNIDLDKYYKTGQTINGNVYKNFNLTSWSEDAFSIINKCTVYISSQSPGIKYIMFYDNWGAYLSNGNQSGWQRDNSTRYMTFVTATQKNIITILENLL